MQNESSVEKEMQDNEEQTPKCRPLPEGSLFGFKTQEKPKQAKEEQYALVDEEETNIGE